MPNNLWIFIKRHLENCRGIFHHSQKIRQYSVNMFFCCNELTSPFGFCIIKFSSCWKESTFKCRACCFKEAFYIIILKKRRNSWDVHYDIALQCQCNSLNELYNSDLCDICTGNDSRSIGMFELSCFESKRKFF